MAFAWPPPASLYTIDVPTKQVSAKSGQSATVTMTYTNGTGFEVRMPLFGPCRKVTSGTATVDCSGKLPAVVVGPHGTVGLTGTVWARSGFSATGRPLAAGPYVLPLGDLRAVTSGSDPDYPHLTVP